MRFLLTPTGSRGDIQPLFALALGLREAGHSVLVASGKNYAAEAAAFGIDFRPQGIDVLDFLEKSGLRMRPMEATREIFRLGRRELERGVDELLPMAREADVVVGGGAQISARCAADAAGVPYWYVAYTPQAMRSRWHAPFAFPQVDGGPRWLNALAWSLFIGVARAVFAGPLGRKRRELKLDRVADYEDHFFPRARMILAADPELAPPPPDRTLPFEPTGALHLPDARPLPAEVEEFLARGAAPVYVGFGSMPVEDPARTTALVVEAARKARTRLILSRGWGGLGAAQELGDGVLVTGPCSHALLFPRMAAVVHHGGSGTTSAAARAGVPQVVIPHAFDQFMWGRLVQQAGVGAAAIPMQKLTARKLQAALEGLDGVRAAARSLGDRLRSRDGVANAVAILTRPS